MNAYLSLMTVLPIFGLALLIFGFAPGFVLRLLLLLYPRDDVRRAELLGELYGMQRLKRPMWVAEQIETALFEGPQRRLRARRLAQAMQQAAKKSRLAAAEAEDRAREARQRAEDRAREARQRAEDQALMAHILAELQAAQEAQEAQQARLREALLRVQALNDNSKP